MTILVSALVAASINSGAFLVQVLPENGPSDFLVFWHAGRSAEPYAVRVMPFLNPPPALFLFKPLGQIGLAAALILWTAASVGLFSWAAARHAGLAAAGASLVSRPTVQGLFLGQCSMLLSGIVLLAFSIPGFAGGLLLGIVAATKPQLVLLAPVALLARRAWSMLLGMAVASCCLALLSFLLWPDAWPAWVAVLPHLHEALMDVDGMPVVITPAGRADSLGLPSLPFLLAGTSIAVAATWALARRLEGIYLAGLVVAASLLASPYALLHDLVALMPVAIIMILRGNLPVALSGAALFCVSHELAPYLLAVGLFSLAVWHGIYGKFHSATPGSFQYLKTPAPGSGPVEVQMR